jgi:outer membrane protein assembly factor BamE
MSFCPPPSPLPRTDRIPPRPVAAIAAAVLFTCALGACGLRMPQPYSPPLQQGNVIEQDALSRLKPGMTRSQVRFALGTPLVVDVFRNDRWDYVYLLRRQGEAPQQRRIAVFFDGDLLVRIEGDVVPGSGTVPQPRSSGAEASKPVAAKPGGGL